MIFGMKLPVEVRRLLRQIPRSALLLFSVVSLAACGPPDRPDPSLADVAQAAARQDDRVSVEELAGWLIEGREDFKLIDLRSAEDFDLGHIAGAANIPITQLVSANVLGGLPTDRMVIVYSNGSENAAKAAVMLRLSGFDGHLLTGGFNAWHKRILNPEISAQALDGESLQVSEQRAYSCYFVGERSDAENLRRNESSEPFVPPVFVETEETEELPPPPSAEGC